MNSTLMEPTATVLGPAPAAKRRRRDVAWRALVAANFLALIGVALALRGWQLGNIPGLNGDEAWLGVQAAHLAAGETIAWRTPTGNPVNPFLLLPVAALQWMFGPSVVVLRVMALASGVAALAANFWLCRRVFDRRSALMSTAVLAVLPIAIAYSRFAWDASQTLLATVVVLYFGLSTVDREVAPAAGQGGKSKHPLPASQTPPDWLPACVAFGVAIWIHPTNVFALWLLIVPAVYRYGNGWRTTIGADWQGGGGNPATGWFKPRLVSGIALATVGIFLAVGGWCCRGLLGAAAWRLIDPAQGGLFVRRLVQLLSGVTIFEFIPGPARTTTALNAADAALVSLMAVAALGVARRLRQADSGRERCLAWAVALMVGTFYLVAGPAALAPHFERYGMCLVAPIGVLLALGWGYWLGSRDGERSRLKSRGPDKSDWASRPDGSGRVVLARVAAVVLAAAAWLWLADFYGDYFRMFRSSGGASHVAFRTAAIEPKLAALETITRAEAVGSDLAIEANKQIWIVADSWWSYWPLAYFASPRHEIHVVAADRWPAVSRQVAANDAVWRVKFVADGLAGQLTTSTVPENRAADKTTIRDYAGAPLLTVERMQKTDHRPTAAAN